MAIDRSALLESVEKAILALTERGLFSYSVQGRSYTALDLDRLIRWRDQLTREIADERRGGRQTVTGVVSFKGTSQ